MNKENEHNEIDQLLRERFGEHTIYPEKELWNKIERRMEPRTVPFHKYSRLKLAFIGSAAVAAGLLLLVLLQKEAPTESGTIPATTSKTKQASNTQKQTSPVQKDNVLPKTIAATLVHPKQETPVSLLAIQQKQAEIEPVAGTPLAYLAPKSSKIQQTENKVDIQSLQENKKLPENKKHVAALSSGKTRHRYKPLITFNNNHRKNSANRYYARRAAQKSWFRGGKLADKMETRIVFSPAYSYRSINNQSNIAVVEFNKKSLNENEKGRFTAGGGLELAFNINKNWSVYSGLKYSSYRLIHETTAEDLNPDMQKNSIQTSAGELFLSGVDVAALPQSTLFTSELKLNSLDIPLVVRYNVAQQLYAGAGITYSRLIADHSTMRVNSPDLNFNFEKIQGLNANNLSLTLEAGYEFVSKSGFRIGIGPEVNFRLSNQNRTGIINSKPFSVGIKTGIYLSKYKSM